MRKFWGRDPSARQGGLCTRDADRRPLSPEESQITAPQLFKDRNLVAPETNVSVCEQLEHCWSECENKVPLRRWRLLVVRKTDTIPKRRKQVYIDDQKLKPLPYTLIKGVPARRVAITWMSRVVKPYQSLTKTGRGKNHARRALHSEWGIGWN